MNRRKKPRYRVDGMNVGERRYFAASANLVRAAAASWARRRGMTLRVRQCVCWALVERVA